MEDVTPSTAAPQSARQTSFGLVSGSVVFWLSVACALGLALLGSYGERLGQALPTLPSIAHSAGAGMAAPAFDLESAAAPDRLRLMDLKGHPVVLNFWATWCAPCQLEMPELQQFQRR